MDPSIYFICRYVVDLKVLGFCPSAELVSAGGEDDLRDVDAGYHVGDIVRVAALEVILIQAVWFKNDESFIHYLLVILFH